MNELKTLIFLTQEWSKLSKRPVSILTAHLQTKQINKQIDVRYASLFSRDAKFALQQQDVLRRVVLFLLQSSGQREVAGQSAERDSHVFSLDISIRIRLACKSDQIPLSEILTTQHRPSS